MRYVHVLVAMLAVGAFPSTIRAQDSRSEVARRDLLERAERARAAGDHATALALASQAAEVRQTPSLRLMLAQEHRATGHMVEALDHATACVRETEADATLRNRERIAEVCRTLASEVEPSIGRLIVQVTPASATGLRVRVGDADLPISLLGVPGPVMPGRVTVRVEARGFRISMREVVIAAGREALVEVPLDAEQATAPRVEGEHGAMRTPDSGSSRPSGPEAGPWVTVGLGAAGLATGLVLFTMSNSAQADRDLCTVAACLGAATESNALYESLLTGANVAWGVGGAAVAAGLLWWIVAPRGAGRAPASASLAPLQGGVGVQIGGSL